MTGKQTTENWDNNKMLRTSKIGFKNVKQIKYNDVKYMGDSRRKIVQQQNGPTAKILRCPHVRENTNEEMLYSSTNAS